MRAFTLGVVVGAAACFTALAWDAMRPRTWDEHVDDALAVIEP